jgi:hypothetical protein
LPATARNRRSHRIPTIACAARSVTNSAPVTQRAAPGQEIVGRDEHGAEPQVEVGVHRGPFRSAMPLSTADFDPAARFSLPTPNNTATI